MAPKLFWIVAAAALIALYMFLHPWPLAPESTSHTTYPADQPAASRYPPPGNRDIPVIGSKQGSTKCQLPTYGPSDLKGGVPRMDEYNSLIQSTKFKEIEVFSSEWQALHQATMEEYRKNWVADPLHWWSRQYEYPYHIEHISNFLKGCPQGVEILDVGTGTSFMPWWLLNKFPGLRLTALDIDPANGRYHKEINDRYVAAGKNNMKTDFVLGSALEMPFKDNTFDLAYSVSILEHIPDFPRALQEVSRVLKPGGIFVLTFDISITPGQDISVNEVGSLFGRILSSGFAEVRHPDAKFVTMKQLRDKSIPGIMFSETVRETLGDAYWQRVHASWYQSGLTVSCHVFLKTGL